MNKEKYMRPQTPPAPLPQREAPTMTKYATSILVNTRFFVRGAGR